MTWPDPHRSRARQLMRDAAFDLMRWPKYTEQICDDLRKPLEATEEAMKHHGELPCLRLGLDKQT
jgi:hypothetical protein